MVFGIEPLCGQCLWKIHSINALPFRERIVWVVIEPVRIKSYDLDLLLDGIASNAKYEAIDLGHSAGKEAGMKILMVDENRVRKSADTRNKNPLKVRPIQF